jgi:predicted nucleotidyltransferase
MTSVCKENKLKRLNTMNISVPQRRIDEFCVKYNIHTLSFFGSVLRDDFRPDSDVDILVEFETGHVPGFIGLAGMERELSEILGGRRVDMRTPQDLSKFFRQKVVSEAEVLYAT